MAEREMQPKKPETFQIMPEETAKPAICQHLRSKTYYYQADGQEMAASAIGAYWCLKTMRPDGPDLELAEPETCRAGRECFEEE